MVWALADSQGTVRDLVDDSGNVVGHFSYDSFGNVINPTGLSFRYGYTGREWDGETGQYYYRARYYDPTVGRFISEDPIGFAAGDTNIYRYVGNSPTDFVDPSGNLARLPIPNNRPAPPINRPIIRSRPPVNIPYDRSPIGYPLPHSQNQQHNSQQHNSSLHPSRAPVSHYLVEHVIQIHQEFFP
jgi:RHS repeat-associated protein